MHPAMLSSQSWNVNARKACPLNLAPIGHKPPFLTRSEILLQRLRNAGFRRRVRPSLCSDSARNRRLRPAAVEPLTGARSLR